MLSLFLPERCVHCGSPSRHGMGGERNLAGLCKYLCEVCYRVLLATEGPTETEVREQLTTIAPQLPIEHCLTAFTFVPESPIQSVVHTFKYAGMPALARECGSLIARSIPATIDYLVPVPLHRTRLAERGYNQSEAIALGVARKSRATVARAVKRTRPTPSQTKLSITERVENVRGAFGLTRTASRIKGKHIMIVDDVMTTGSTLASVAETLLTANPHSISILTLAIAERPV